MSRFVEVSPNVVVDVEEVVGVRPSSSVLYLQSKKVYNGAYSAVVAIRGGIEWSVRSGEIQGDDWDQIDAKSKALAAETAATLIRELGLLRPTPLSQELPKVDPA